MLLFSVVVCLGLINSSFGAVYSCVGGGALYEADNTCIFYPLGQSGTKSSMNILCNADGGVVVDINSAEKNDFVNTLQVFNPTTEIWISVNDDDLDGTFTKDDGTSLNPLYQPWLIQPENNFSGQSCVYRDSDQEWVIADCNDSKEVLCEVGATQLINGCDLGWNLTPDELFCVRPIRGRRRGFQKAHEYCINKYSGQLATKISSVEEMGAAMSGIDFLAHFWIGILDDGNDNTFLDIDGNALGPSPPFKRGSPDPADPRCITIKKRRGGTFWYPKPCNKRLFFVCQKYANLENVILGR